MLDDYLRANNIEAPTRPHATCSRVSEQRAQSSARPPNPATSRAPVDLEEPVILDTGDDLILPGSGNPV
jgi:hypothetical protein